jgi:hypothetical protein
MDELMKKKEPCTCSRQGGICGDMTYDEMFKAMLASKQDSQQGFNRLLEIHLKWKRLAAEVR